MYLVAGGWHGWPGTGRKEGFLCQKLQDVKLSRKSLSKACCGMCLLDHRFWKPSGINGVSCAPDVGSLRPSVTSHCEMDPSFK